MKLAKAIIGTAGLASFALASPTLAASHHRNVCANMPDGSGHFRQDEAGNWIRTADGKPIPCRFRAAGNGGPSTLLIIGGVALVGGGIAIAATSGHSKSP
jgi:hypothetical protein